MFDCPCRFGQHFDKIGTSFLSWCCVVIKSDTYAFMNRDFGLFWTVVLLVKWKVSATDIIQAVNHGFRAQVDVKGKLAEGMLFKEFNRLRSDGIARKITWLDEDGRPDFIIEIDKREFIVECKNVRSPNTKRKSPEPIRVELQKTRNAMDGSNTRGYTTDHFDVLSACLFNRTGNWDFAHIAMKNLITRPGDPGFLKVMQEVSPISEYPWRATFIEAIKDLKK